VRSSRWCYSRINTSAATLTKNRTEGSATPSSGMCVTCVDGCIGMCEIGKSAYRGHEVIYPQPFGVITTAAEKTYPVDYSHFNIMGTAAGAHGIEADSDKAIFPAVNLEVRIGRDQGIKFRRPWIISGIGSTNVAKNNWEGLAIGSALFGKTIGRTIEENQIPVYDERFGNSKEEIFVTSGALRKELGDEEFEKLPTGALGLYTNFERLDQGLRQLITGSRKFTTSQLSRNDLAAPTREAAEISGIQYVMETDQDEVERLFSA